MDEEPLNIIRKSTRDLIKINRRIHKNEESDLRRSIKEIKITSEDVSKIANKLKTKSVITVAELQMLKNGLIENTSNVDIFLNVHGALRGLIRELTGHNVKKQCAAAGCCCNLALGDSKSCTTIAKAIGSYLVASLDNLTLELAVTCMWTLGNLAGAGPKACNVLVAQGALSKLCDFYTSEDLQDAALYSLVHFSYQMRDELHSDYLQKIIATLSKIEISTASANLLFIISCHKDFLENITEQLLYKVLQDLHPAIESHKTCIKTDKCCKLVYLLRILANMEGMYSVILNYFLTYNMVDPFKMLLSSNMVGINNSLLWLLGNLYKFAGKDHSFLSLILR